MISFVDETRKIITDFKQRIDAITGVMETQKKKWEDFKPEIQKKYIAELEEYAEPLTHHVRMTGFEQLDSLMERARAFFTVSVSEIDASEIMKLQTVFSLGTPTEYETQVLLDSVEGSYWGLCFMSDRLNDGSVSGILNAPIRPNVQEYLNLLDEIHSACKTFISGYVGEDPVYGQTGGENTVHSMLILNDSTWIKWRERIDTINPRFCSDSSILMGALTTAERNTLDKMIPLGRSETETKQRVIQVAEMSAYYQSILLRSHYAPIVSEYLKQKEAEETRKQTQYTPFEGAFQRWSEKKLNEKWKH